MLREKTMVFVWRCPDCTGEYGGESLPFLYADGDHRYCPCGGRLVEGVAPEGERHYRLVLPEHFRGTSLYRQLEERLADEEGVEVALGCREDRHINLQFLQLNLRSER
jgi:hypothetical protein